MQRIAPDKVNVLHSMLERFKEADDEYTILQEHLARTQAGYSGEQLIDILLENATLAEYRILHAIELEKHPIDTLIISPKFILILEIKNMAGRLEIDDERHQCIRTRHDGTVETFSNPTDQVKKYRNFIVALLGRWKIDLPVECAVVIANPRLLIGNINSGVPVFHKSGLLHRIALMEGSLPEKLSANQVNKLAEQLISMHSPYRWQPKIDKNKLRSGVLCLTCKSVMDYVKGAWVCSSCSQTSKGLAALEKAMQDYRNIWGDTITNREFREFTGIEGSHIANYLLKKLDLPYQGINRHRVYSIPRRELVEKVTIRTEKSLDRASKNLDRR